MFREYLVFTMNILLIVFGKTARWSDDLRKMAGRSWMREAEDRLQFACNWRGLCPAVDCDRLMMTQTFQKLQEIGISCVFDLEESNRFRILAPEIVCPKDENSVVEKPDHTIITLHTQADISKFIWTVRWAPLKSPGQRFTLLIWKTVRALEAQLNGPQQDPFVYVINNTELLKGVDYIFNVTGIEQEDTNTSKSFHIDNVKGDQKIIVEGRSDKFSVYLVGGDVIYIDMEYVLEAEVTTCSPTQDYYFQWRVKSNSGEIIDVSDITGWRLELPPYTLKAGASYYVSCQIVKNTTVFTQTDLIFRVQFRGLRVYLNFDTLIITVGHPFTILTFLENADYNDTLPTFNWSCIYQNENCKNFESTDGDILEFSTGLADVGQYLIAVEVNILDQTATANATINTVEPNLPIIQIDPVSRTVNEGTIIKLVANASNVAPACTLTWYFATEEYLATCQDCQHGESLTETLTIFSLEENFLNELADFTNDTEWRQVTVYIPAETGRARFYVECGCSLAFSCQTEGAVSADVYLQVNKGPEVGEVKITPETGTAMETIFRVTKPVATDPDKPLRYTLLCSIGEEDNLVLASNLQHLAVDTFLPFTANLHGTMIWVEVCDSLGACSSTERRPVPLSPGEGRTVQVLVDEVKGYVSRCEMMRLNRAIKSAVVTYTNADQSEPLSFFIKCLLEILPETEEHCLKSKADYSILLNWLAGYGVDTNNMTL